MNDNVKIFFWEFFNNSFVLKVFQSENDTLKQLVIRDGHDKQTISELQRQNNKFYIVKFSFLI
jgi:hypothetical protein